LAFAGGFISFPVSGGHATGAQAMGRASVEPSGQSVVLRLLSSLLLFSAYAVLRRRGKAQYEYGPQDYAVERASIGGVVFLLERSSVLGRWSVIV